MRSVAFHAFRTFSGFCGCPLAGLGLDAEPPHPDVCTALSSCHARRASRSLWSSKQIQSGCKERSSAQSVEVKVEERVCCLF